MLKSLLRICCAPLTLIALSCLIASSAEAGTSLRGKGYVLNNGQWPSNVIALALGGDVDVWVTKSGVVYDHCLLYTSDAADE